MHRNLIAVAWILMLIVHCAQAERPWPRHTIDDSSRGADGVRLADVNGDGLKDIVTGWEEGGVIRAYLHPGQKQAGGRWPAVTVGRVGSPEDAVFADLDGDGRSDVVSSSEGKTRTVHFHWAPPAGHDYLDASGWTTDAVACTSGKQMWMFALPMQVDGRHGVDVIVGSKGADASIGWLESPAKARDGAAWKYHRLRDAGWIMSLEAHDLNGDGDLDVLASDRKEGKRGVFWLENPGAEQAAQGAAWVEHTIGGQDQQVMFLARGRIGRDETQGIACAVSGGGVLLLHPRGNGWVQEEVPLPEGVGTGKGIALGDLDGDGDGDLAFTCENAKGPLSGVRWLEYTGEAEQPWRSHEIGGPEGVKFDRIELLDLDGDNDLDLLTCEERDNLGVVWYENVVNSLGELTAPRQANPSSKNPSQSKTIPAAVDARSQSTTKPNIIFVLMDDMGYADLGCYGAKDIRTPNIDRLAREGLRFTDFYANAPVCTPTRCGFMTGRWQQRVGLEWAMGYTAEQVRRVDGKWVPEPDMHALGLPLGETTIASLLKNAGYATGAFGKWHLGYLPQFNPTRRGFDEYFGTLLGHSDYYRYQYFDGTYELRDGEQPALAEGYLTDLLSRRAVEFIGKHAREPFFLYLPHQAVHAPYQPPDRPEPAVSKQNMNDGDRRTYAAMLQRVDEGIGQMLAELDRHGLANNTLFVFSSDNGGAHFSDNSPLFNGKQSLWEGGIRVPCLMRWPARLPAGKVIHQPAITMDLTATFLAVAGGEAAKDRPLDGINLMPLLIGEQQAMPRTFCWRVQRTGRQQKAIRYGNWKYILDGGYLGFLFDVEQDPGERHNQALAHPEVVADLQKRLAAWEAEMDASPREWIVR